MVTVEDIDLELQQGMVIASLGGKHLLYYPLKGEYVVEVDGHIVMLGTDEHKAKIVDKYNSIQG